MRSLTERIPALKRCAGSAVYCRYTPVNIQISEPGMMSKNAVAIRLCRRGRGGGDNCWRYACVTYYHPLLLGALYATDHDFHAPSLFKGTFTAMQ